MPAKPFVFVNANRELVRARRDHFVGADRRARSFAVQVVHVAQAAVEQVEREPAERRAHREQARPRPTAPLPISTSAVIVCARFGTCTADGSGTGAPYGCRRNGCASRAARARVQDRVRAAGCRAAARRCVAASCHQSSIMSCEALGLLRGEVVALGEVVGDVVQLPHVVVERRVGVEPVVVHVAERVERHRLPTVVVDRAGARASRSTACVCGSAASALVRPRRGSSCRRSATARRCRSKLGVVDPDQLEHGRQHVDRVRELVADRRRRPRRGASREPDDARIGDTAFVHLTLPALERRVARHRPAPRIVVVRRRAAELVDAVAELATPGWPRRCTGARR